MALQRADDTIKVTLNATTPTTLTASGASPACRSWSRAPPGALRQPGIALVLDNTGSMRGTKLANLKAAATDLVNSLFKEVDPAKRTPQMAVVPFSMTVNVGPANAGRELDRQGRARPSTTPRSSPRRPTG